MNLVQFANDHFFRKEYWVVFAICFLAACAEKEEHLPIDKMSKVLLELHVAESYAKQLPSSAHPEQRGNEDSLKYFVAAILKENKIAEKEFTQSMDWYAKQPELLDSIYQQILNDVAVWQSKYN